MLNKLKDIKKRYDELSNMIAQPEATQDIESWKKLVKEHSSLEPMAAKCDEYQAVLNGIEDCRSMLSDPEMRELAQQELEGLKEKQEQLEEEIK